MICNNLHVEQAIVTVHTTNLIDWGIRMSHSVGYESVENVLLAIKKSLASSAHITENMKPRHGGNPGLLAIRKGVFKNDLQQVLSIDALVIKMILVHGKASILQPKIRIQPFELNGYPPLYRELHWIFKKYPAVVMYRPTSLNNDRLNRGWKSLAWYETVLNTNGLYEYPL